MTLNLKFKCYNDLLDQMATKISQVFTKAAPRWCLIAEFSKNTKMYKTARQKSVIVG